MKIFICTFLQGASLFFLNSCSAQKPMQILETKAIDEPIATSTENGLELQELYRSHAYAKDISGALALPKKIYFYGFEKPETASPLKSTLEEYDIETHKTNSLYDSIFSDNKIALAVCGLFQIDDQRIAIFTIENKRINSLENLLGGDLILYVYNSNTRTVEKKVLIFLSQYNENNLNDAGKADWVVYSRHAIKALHHTNTNYRFVIQRLGGMSIFNLKKNTFDVEFLPGFIRRSAEDILLTRDFSISSDENTQSSFITVGVFKDSFENPEVSKSIDFSLSPEQIVTFEINEEGKSSLHSLSASLDSKENALIPSSKTVKHGHYFVSPAKSKESMFSLYSILNEKVLDLSFDPNTFSKIGINDYISLGDQKYLFTGTANYEQASTGSLMKDGDLFVALVVNGHIAKHVQLATKLHDGGDILLESSTGEIFLFGRIAGPLTHSRHRQNTLALYKINLY